MKYLILIILLSNYVFAFDLMSGETKIVAIHSEDLLKGLLPQTTKKSKYKEVINKCNLEKVILRRLIQMEYRLIIEINAAIQRTYDLQGSSVKFYMWPDESAKSMAEDDPDYKKYLKEKK